MKSSKCVKLVHPHVPTLKIHQTQNMIYSRYMLDLLWFLAPWPLTMSWWYVPLQGFAGNSSMVLLFWKYT